MSFSCPNFSPISFSTNCPIPPPIVQLDDFELYRIIEWEDTIVQEIPKLPVVGKSLPTPDASCLVTDPQMITIIVRMNDTDKDYIWQMYGWHRWHCLSQNYAAIAYVWMETVRVRNDCETDANRPWLVTLNLVC